MIQNQKLDTEINKRQEQNQEETIDASTLRQSYTQFQNQTSMVEISLDDAGDENHQEKETRSMENPRSQKDSPQASNKSQVDCLPISRLLSKVPRLTKFFFLEVNIGVSYFNIALIFLWITYFLGALFGKADADSYANGLWGLVWCLANAASSYSVFYGMKHSRRLYLVPALFLGVFNFVAGGINILINFIFLNPFAGIWLMILTALNIYYVVGVKTVFDSMPCALPPWLHWLHQVSTEEEWVEDEEQGLRLMEDENLGFEVEDDRPNLGSV